MLTKKKVEDDDDFEALVNPVTVKVTPATGDVNCAALVKGDVLQLERKGYYIVDAPAEGGKPAALFAIPDGRSRPPPPLWAAAAK